MTTALILNIAIAATVFAGILGLIGWAIATHHRDHHAMHGIASGARRRRRRGARTLERRAHGQAWQVS